MMKVNHSRRVDDPSGCVSPRATLHVRVQLTRPVDDEVGEDDIEGIKARRVCYVVALGDW